MNHVKKGKSLKCENFSALDWEKEITGIVVKAPKLSSELLELRQYSDEDLAPRGLAM